MKKIILTVSELLLVSFAQGQAISHGLTPAQQQIAWAQSAIKADSERTQPYNDLAVAYVRRARETGDSSYLNQADIALQASTKRTSDNVEGQKARAMVLLGRGQFIEALQFAKMLNAKTPDDISIYGFIADAATELGKYNEAERATQWMLDLREGNVPGLLRAARLRSIYGDTDGALDFYSQAYQQIPPTQTEDQAWTLTKMAEIQLSTGHLDEAGNLLQSALQKFPGYYLSLESSARVETARQHYMQAVALLRKRNDSFPSLSSRYALAKALEHAGQTAEAIAAYSEFETKALSASNAESNANRDLVLYYLGSGNKPAEALRIAEHETGKRHDVSTLDAYAWALCGNGRYDEAQTQISFALAVGIRDAEMLYHAGVIAEKRLDHISAVRYFKGSLELNPSSEVSREARDALAKSMGIPVMASNTH